MLHMPLFQIELLMKISGRSNFSRKIKKKNSQIVLQIKKMKKKLSLLRLADYSRIFEKLKKKDKKDLD